MGEARVSNGESGKEARGCARGGAVGVGDAELTERWMDKTSIRSLCMPESRRRTGGDSPKAIGDERRYGRQVQTAKWGVRGGFVAVRE